MDIAARLAIFLATIMPGENFYGAFLARTGPLRYTATPLETVSNTEQQANSAAFTQIPFVCACYPAF
eukprot:456723-Pleurochrysis_carterae.AAC.1